MINFRYKYIMKSISKVFSINIYFYLNNLILVIIIEIIKYFNYF